MCFHEFLLRLFFIWKYSDIHIYIYKVSQQLVSISGLNSGANSQSTTSHTHGSSSERFSSYEHMKYFK
jgi:hypothetical protein